MLPRDFAHRFKNNSDLNADDFGLFPAKMRAFLRLSRPSYEAFSRKIAPRTYVFVITHDASGTSVSKAVLITVGGRRLSATKGIHWSPLTLPSLTKAQRGWSVVVTEEHFKLTWDEDLGALQSTYCSDVPPYACLRQTTRISPGLQELVLAEVRGEGADAWKPIWKEGQWLIDPNVR